MLLSKLVCATTKEAPSDAKIISHILLARAGYIKLVANGIYSLTMPAQRMSLKIEAIIRDEMDKIDGQEVKFPVVMPRELWESSGRYNTIGNEMVRFKDRCDRDMLLGMTHEEAAVHLVKNTVNSYQQLPFMIYQLQTKFRDEARSRGGLIRVREFTMKDGYSFHISQEDLEKYYERAYQAYFNIFNRIGLKKFIAVKSDTGMMGGNVAHEYMLLTPDGEDDLVLCDKCGYKSNMEVADSVITAKAGVDTAMSEIFTANAKTIDEVKQYLNIEENDTIKAVVYAVRGVDELVCAFIRGDLEVNEAKLKKATGKNVVPCEASLENGFAAGNIGPIGLNVKNCVCVFDKSLESCVGMVCGANKPEYHIKGVNVARDLANVTFSDIKKVKAGDKCPVCGAELHLENGIEIGNIFQLGTKYSSAMNLTVLNEKGENVNPIMGCYGIGVGRAIASIAQESNDERGLILPITIAPWQVHICALRYDDAAVKEAADTIYNTLQSKGIDTLLDERAVSPGVKFADADLMGMPIRMVISPKSLQNGMIEIKLRKDAQSYTVAKDSIYDEINKVIEILNAELRIK